MSHHHFPTLLTDLDANDKCPLMMLSRSSIGKRDSSCLGVHELHDQRVSYRRLTCDRVTKNVPPSRETVSLEPCSDSIPIGADVLAPRYDLRVKDCWATIRRLQLSYRADTKPIAVVWE